MMFDLIQSLELCREAEREQALFYRSLAAEAEERGDAALSERFNELHADEQHHLSRLTARLLELGGTPSRLDGLRAQPGTLSGWESVALQREHGEVERYESLLRHDLDRTTDALIQQILEVERHHARELGGKWMPA